MASRRQWGAGAGAGDVPAQERKGGALMAAAAAARWGGEAAKIARRPKTTTVVAQQPPRIRRALADVSNLVNGRAALPVVNRQKAAAAAADKCRKPIKQRNENNKAAKPEVIVISSDSEKHKKNPAQRAASRRAPIQTLTSILTKCSRASDGVISPKKELIYDIDASDAHNELAVVDYVEDIYRFYRNTENTYRPLCTYMVSQTEINERMRAILTDWLIEVHYRLMLMPETLYLTVYIIDQYLSLENVPRKELQLVGVKDFLVISDNSFSRQQVLSTEKSILNKLQWNLTVPTMYMFILRYLKAALGDEELEHMTFFYAELALVQYSMLFFAPSVIAAAAVYAARCTLGLSPLWSDLLEYHTGLAEPQLLECARRLVSLHAAAPESRQKVVYKKYASPKLGAVSLHSPAKKLLPPPSPMSSMACHSLPESGSNLSAADELFQNQRSEQGIYWTLWDSRLSDDLNTTTVYSDNHGSNGGGTQSFDTSEHCSTVPSDSDEQPGYPSQFEPLHMEQTNDMSQFSDEEVRRMDAPFQALDMFPDSMHRLMSYEHILNGALVSDSKNQEVNMDQDDMDTCGFPLYFSHGLQDDGGLPSFAKGMAGASATERGDPGSSPPGFEEAVLEELEEVMVQMARTTRICLRDAFYRLAEGSRSPRSAAAAADGAAVAEATRYHAQAAVDLSRSLLEILQLVILMLSVSSSPLAAANPLQCVDDAAAPSPRRDRQDGGEPHLQAAAVLAGSRGGDDAAHACLRRPSSPSPDHRRTGGDSLVPGIKDILTTKMTPTKVLTSIT
uniref:Cyclin N-terminal domain-containing protein n=1 Tax=Oryza glumipatula TaxID=40148 RepID=A0A0D9Y6U8_9ORYZ